MSRTPNALLCLLLMIARQAAGGIRPPLLAPPWFGSNGLFASLETLVLCPESPSRQLRTQNQHRGGRGALRSGDCWAAWKLVLVSECLPWMATTVMRCVLGSPLGLCGPGPVNGEGKERRYLPVGVCCVPGLGAFTHLSHLGFLPPEADLSSWSRL